MSHVKICSLAGAFLIVSIGVMRYAVSVRHTKEIVRQRRIAPLAKPGRNVCGLVEFEGRSLPVVAIEGVWGYPAGFGRHACLVVVQPECRGVVDEVALLDDVESIETLSAGEIEAEDQGLSSGTARLQGVRCPIVDVDRLAAALGS